MAKDLQRRFCGDQDCLDEVRSFGGQGLVDRYLSFVSPAHRADLWRYIMLYNHGGSYLDIKIRLLRPLAATVDRILGESGGRVQHGTQHLIMTIGSNCKHVFQGTILSCARGHPLMLACIQDAIRTEQPALRKCYLRFCNFIFAQLEADLPTPAQGSKPALRWGWNYCMKYGPVYLMQEKKISRPVACNDVNGESAQCDGHFIFLREGDPETAETAIAATRAWGWHHGFKDQKHVQKLIVDAEQVGGKSALRDTCFDAVVVVLVFVSAVVVVLVAAVVAVARAAVADLLFIRCRHAYAFRGCVFSPSGRHPIPGRSTG